jgi:hypothetical protein
VVLPETNLEDDFRPHMALRTQREIDLILFPWEQSASTPASLFKSQNAGGINFDDT